MKTRSSEDWPEPIVRVQSLSESGLCEIPDRYIKPPPERPTSTLIKSEEVKKDDINIPIIDLEGLYGFGENRYYMSKNNNNQKKVVAEQISEACKEWGFFQIVNHGVKPELLEQTRQVWREFFQLPMEKKQVYANSPKTYEGYGSRLGVEKGTLLDWVDYYYLHYLPLSLKDYNKWPSQPSNSRFFILYILIIILILFFF